MHLTGNQEEADLFLTAPSCWRRSSRRSRRRVLVHYVQPIASKRGDPCSQTWPASRKQHLKWGALFNPCNAKRLLIFSSSPEKADGHKIGTTFMKRITAILFVRINFFGDCFSISNICQLTSFAVQQFPNCPLKDTSTMLGDLQGWICFFSLLASSPAPFSWSICCSRRWSSSASRCTLAFFLTFIPSLSSWTAASCWARVCCLIFLWVRELSISSALAFGPSDLRTFGPPGWRGSFCPILE
jgi:hypothetical protein